MTSNDAAIIISYSCSVSSAVRWQDWADSSSQLEAIGGLAAHIHITTSDKLSQVYGSYSRMMVSPRILMECLTLAQHIAVNIKAKERVSKIRCACKQGWKRKIVLTIINAWNVSRGIFRCQKTLLSIMQYPLFGELG